MMIAHTPENDDKIRHGALSASSIAFDLVKAEAHIAALEVELAAKNDKSLAASEALWDEYQAWRENRND